MATHSSVLAWRIPGTGEPGGLLSMGSHRVGHDWSDLAAVAATLRICLVWDVLLPSLHREVPSLKSHGSVTQHKAPQACVSEAKHFIQLEATINPIWHHDYSEGQCFGPWPRIKSWTPQICQPTVFFWGQLPAMAWSQHTHEQVHARIQMQTYVDSCKYS